MAEASTRSVRNTRFPIFGGQRHHTNFTTLAWEANHPANDFLATLAGSPADMAEAFLVETYASAPVADGQSPDSVAVADASAPVADERSPGSDASALDFDGRSPGPAESALDSDAPDPQTADAVEKNDVALLDVLEYVVDAD